jgi:anti-sigma regulatory factor (Ser/Thr protein kinase)
MGILRLSLQNQLPELKRLGFALNEFLDEEGVPPDAVRRIRLVIEELFVNVISHGYDDAVAHAITLDVRTEPGRATVVIDDDGRPFDPRNAPPPVLQGPLEERPESGYGIYIVRHLTSDFGYTRENDRNRVRAVVEYQHPKEST